MHANANGARRAILNLALFDETHLPLVCRVNNAVLANIDDAGSGGQIDIGLQVQRNIEPYQQGRSAS